MRNVRRHPDNVISYIIDRNINYTNVCKEFCTFCACYRVKGDAEAYVLPDEDKVVAAVQRVLGTAPVTA